jgi:putative ABC transport system permease protein
MLAFKLAYKNLIGAGLRTWLNVIVLSFSFFTIIWFKGMLDGWDRQAKHDMIAWEMGGGQYWQKEYDPYDPFTLNESHSLVTGDLKKQVDEKRLTPLLYTQGTIYPEGRIQSVVLKGIDPKQQIIDLPSWKLDTITTEVPALIGTKMASNNKLNVGDYVMIRWRDINGTFDATEVLIVGVFKTNVPSVDAGQIWLPLKNLQEMTVLSGEASVLVSAQGYDQILDQENWEFKNLTFLLSEIDQIIKAKSGGGSVFYLILLLLAMLAIFDTQVMSIFKRQKEIGTYIAMGMTRRQVVGLFTVEGSMHAVLALLVASIYGVPLLILQSMNGIALPVEGNDYGLAMAEKLYPVYSLALIVSTILIVTLTTTIVSYLPARKIAKMKPTDALKGKLQ